ncbi:MAG: hypothetical protein IPP43_03460 [Chitinophagaceae bacterium]|nr:hypothetical protein [Chitinophagaceae bacterium]
MGNIDAAVKELGSEAVKSNEVLKKLLAKMKIPDFVLEYIVFFAEERGKSAFYTKNVSLSLLLGGLKEKIKNKLPRI